MRTPVKTAKRAVVTRLIAQFHHPRGATGRAVGWVLAHRSSNVQRNRWVVSLLDVLPEERVLEIGFGPGRAIADLSRRSEHVYGLDHSAVMLRQASRRNAEAIRTGRVTLTCGSVDRLPPALAGPFDAILSVNSLGSWPEPSERLQELRDRLTPGGRIAIASQPRHPGATAPDAARTIGELLQAAGFTQLTTKTLDLDPPVVCVIAINPGPR
jgi:SAM-dependent methyltransferase